jgi:biotin carboxyl carrier protein
MKRIPVKAPQFGVVDTLLAEPGAQVNVGDVIIQLEAMKMRFDVMSEHAGTVDFVVKLGQTVDEGQYVAYINT